MQLLFTLLYELIYCQTKFPKGGNAPPPPERNPTYIGIFNIVQ